MICITEEDEQKYALCAALHIFPSLSCRQQIAFMNALRVEVGKNVIEGQMGAIDAIISVPWETYREVFSGVKEIAGAVIKIVVLKLSIDKLHGKSGEPTSKDWKWPEGM